MGTRNLTMVVDKTGETKIAQYGQWDGYPFGQGLTVLHFLSDKNSVDKLQEKLKLVRFLDIDVDKDFIDAYNKNCPKWGNEADNRTEVEKKWFEKYVSRDVCAGIL